MRTEFAVLTGLPRRRSVTRVLSPYAFVLHRLHSLAAWFGRGDYETVAIDPYCANFFGRNPVFPLLGFSHFLDIGHFASASRAGPYVMDAAGWRGDHCGTRDGGRGQIARVSCSP